VCWCVCVLWVRPWLVFPGVQAQQHQGLPTAGRPPGGDQLCGALGLRAGALTSVLRATPRPHAHLQDPRVLPRSGRGQRPGQAPCAAQHLRNPTPGKPPTQPGCAQNPPLVCLRPPRGCAQDSPLVCSRVSTPLQSLAPTPPLLQPPSPSPVPTPCMLRLRWPLQLVMTRVGRRQHEQGRPSSS